MLLLFAYLLCIATRLFWVSERWTRNYCLIRLIEETSVSTLRRLKIYALTLTRDLIDRKVLVGQVTSRQPA